MFICSRVNLLNNLWTAMFMWDTHFREFLFTQYFAWAISTLILHFNLFVMSPSFHKVFLFTSFAHSCTLRADFVLYSSTSICKFFLMLIQISCSNQHILFYILVTSGIQIYNVFFQFFNFYKFTDIILKFQPLNPHKNVWIYSFPRFFLSTIYVY